VSKAEQRTEWDVLTALHLPTSGQVVFVPPKGWHPTEPLPRSPRGGYIDRRGREWAKGRSVTRGQHFEWDVQLPHGDHLNVDWEGEVTHPRQTRSSRRNGKRA
jgi:hypothetical protein